MPLYAQVLCIGGNWLFTVIFIIGAISGFQSGEFGTSLFLTVLAGASAYSAWVLMKFRRYLSSEERLERELHIEQLREEIDRLKANNAPEHGGPAR